MVNQQSSVAGKAAEDLACIYLKKHGLKPVERNYRSPRGEIDLIMRDKDTLVFIEVRSRAKNILVEPIETIDRRKQSRIIYSCEHYLQKHQCTNDEICRFDVVLLEGDSEEKNIQWIKNAFEAK